MKKKIHIFCTKPPICNLIKKRFSGSNYLITCSSAENLREDLFETLHKNIDCLIIDKDIKQELKEKIKHCFKDKPMICLPSLDSELLLESEIPDDESGIKNISEPLRLSELAQTLDDIFSLSEAKLAQK